MVVTNTGTTKGVQMAATDTPRFVREHDEDGELTNSYDVLIGQQRIGKVENTYANGYGDPGNPWRALLSRDVRTASDGRALRDTFPTRKAAAAWLAGLAAAATR